MGRTVRMRAHRREFYEPEKVLRDVEEDLLDITAVHPMREEAVDEFLGRAGANWSVVHDLIARDQLWGTAGKSSLRETCAEGVPDSSPALLLPALNRCGATPWEPLFCGAKDPSSLR